MAVTLSDSARARIRGYLDADPALLGLRFGVSRTGCSGWGYKVDMAREQADGDVVFDADGVRIYVDAASLPMVDGTQIDFIKQGLNEQFVFRNPNVAGECGCGESFTTDADKAA
ncbi:MAG: iron-sulfur cluster assembly accessory protein [Thermomonas sp.]|uniref:HesB/IscA family protein n=1 Tax=Thermomonas sp. TaxID=1971895 RepID=UPI0039E2E71D